MSPGFFVPEPPAGPFRSAGSGKLPPGDSAAKHPAPRMPGLEYPTPEIPLRNGAAPSVRPRKSGPKNRSRNTAPPQRPPRNHCPRNNHTRSRRTCIAAAKPSRSPSPELPNCRTAAFHLRSPKISILRNTLLRPQRAETQAFSPILKKFIFRLRRKIFGRFGESTYICHTNKINKANP